MSQIPKPEIIAGSILGKDITQVSQTAKASKLKKNKVMQKECPFSVGKVSEQIRYSDKPKVLKLPQI